jgi:signal transduction histidine kinase
LVAAFLTSALTSTVGPGPTNTSVPLLVAGAWFLGNSVRARRLYTETLEATNRELEQAQHDLARQAVTEERLRIARELHRGAPAPAPAGGHGLAGMRERVAVHGGTLDAGPGPSGGFRVVAHFPLGEA